MRSKTLAKRAGRTQFHKRRWGVRLIGGDDGSAQVISFQGRSIGCLDSNVEPTIVDRIASFAPSWGDRNGGVRHGEEMNDNETLGELENRIALIREDLNELVEQATAYSGAADEQLAADRIADLQAKLEELLKKRDMLLSGPGQA
jgi:hypothetical protein